MQNWTGTVRLNQTDTKTLAWLSRKLDPESLRGLSFADVFRQALRNERARVEAMTKKGNDNGQ